MTRTNPGTEANVQPAISFARAGKLPGHWSLGSG